jgi:hypothetical protein
VKEFEQYRTQTSKVYDLPGRRYRCSTHIGPIHYRDDPANEREPWQDIDRTLRETARGIECLSNTYQVRIDEKSAPGEAEFSYRGRSMRIAPVALEYRTGGTAQRVAAFSATRPVVDGDTVTWPDAFGKGVDFAYTVSHLGFQKRVIVNGDLPPALIGGRDDVRLCAVMAMAWAGVDAPVNANRGRTSTERLLSEGRISTEFSDKAQVLLEVGKVAPAWGDYWRLNPAQAWDGDGGVEAKTELMSDNGNVFAVASVDVGDVKRGLVIDPVLSPIPITDGGDDGAMQYENYGRSGPIDPWDFTRPEISVGDNEDNPINTSAWMRFVNLPIPIGATIDTSFLTLVAMYSAHDGGVTPTGVIQARKVPNCPQILMHEDYRDLITFPRTTAAVTWWPRPSAQWGPVGTVRQSPEIKTVIQEVVDLPGWSPGNAIQVEWLYDGRGWVGSCDDYTSDLRSFAAYEHPTHNGPILNVEYTEGGAPPASLDVRHGSVGTIII